MNALSPFFEGNLKRFTSESTFSLFRGIKRGFEKESLRVDENGFLASTPHPRGLGSSLTHPFITTDYSEALLEFITPPTADLQAPFQGLTDLHIFAYRVLKAQSEMLWTASMPCRLPKEEDIPIAVYGNSNIGMLKHIYRRGLGKRYGRAMQTIAGIHYNFSLPEAFFQSLYDFHHEKSVKAKRPLLKDFISEQYLCMARNCLRWGWLLPLLFGATPAVCKDFVDPRMTRLNHLEPLKESTFYGPYATSLRLSDLGYQNKTESEMIISYNSFPEFIQSMHDAVHTRSPSFAQFGIKQEEDYIQLNDSILQTEDEHYAMVRPKRVSLAGERTLSAMMREGIEYLEIRALDINPFLPIGIEPKTAYFLDAFLITCLFLESPLLDKMEMQRIHSNLAHIVLEGRNPALKLLNGQGKETNALVLAEQFLNLMALIAKILDKAYGIDNFSLACHSAKNSLRDQDSLPSARIIHKIKTQHLSYFEFAKYWSLQHKNKFNQLLFSDKMVQYYQSLANSSLEQQAEMESRDILPFSEFLADFLAP